MGLGSVFLVRAAENLSQSIVRQHRKFLHAEPRAGYIEVSHFSLLEAKAVGKHLIWVKIWSESSG